MTQVLIKKLDSLSHNDTAATKTINDNFQAIEKALEDSLSRKETAPNYMDTDLDMNSKRIINTAEPVSDLDVINKKYFDERVGDAKAHADAAAKSAARAESFAKSAAVANINTQNAVTDLKQYVDVRLEQHTVDLSDMYYDKNEVDDKDNAVFTRAKVEIDLKIGAIETALAEV